VYLAVARRRDAGRQTSEVEHAVDVPHRLACELVVPHVADHQLHPTAGTGRRRSPFRTRLQVSERARGEVIEDPDVVPPFEEGVDQMGADEPTAGDERSSHSDLSERDD
jgi:hypothetical protein